MNLTNALILSRALEFGSTEYAISTNQMGELNPFMKSREMRISSNVAFVIGAPIILKHVEKENKKVAKIVKIGLIVGNGYLTYRTFKIMRSK